MDEMAATDEIGFDSFVAWWLSDSKISAKIRHAKQQDDGVASVLFVCLLGDSEDKLTIDHDDLMSRGKTAFGTSISPKLAGEILRECQEIYPKQGGRGSRDDFAITADTFDGWWRSTAELAQQLRQQRQVDIARTQKTLSDFDVARGPEAKKDNKLDEEELLAMVKKLHIHRTHPAHDVVRDIMLEVRKLCSRLLQIKIRQTIVNVTAILRSNTDTLGNIGSVELDRSNVREVLDALGVQTSEREVEYMMSVATNSSNISGDSLMSFILEPSEDKRDQPRHRIQKTFGVRMNARYLSFLDFFLWMRSGTRLADTVAEAIDVYGKKKELAKEQRFPYVPRFSPFCQAMVLDPTFDKAVLYAIGVNTVIMCLQ
eukprot:SAG31_NODE_8872_length_1370_cov_1.055862_1_plen_370_part_10